MNAKRSTSRRAIGIVRVSQTGGRAGESFASPAEQTDRIAAACKRDGLVLVQTFEELDVSGGKSLAKRAGLLAAVAMIEAGQAEVIAAAYFDRLFRSLKTQAEVIDRVEAVGGQVIAVDVGRITGESAGTWLTSTMMGAVSEYYRRSITERSADAQARAVERGVAPGATTAPVGYVRPRAEDGSALPYAIDPRTAPIIREVFERRAAGGGIAELARLLEGAKVTTGRGSKSWALPAVRGLLRNPAYHGEVRFGKLANPTAHEAIVDFPLWQAAQRPGAGLRSSRSGGEYLLSGSLRCAACGYALEATRESAKHGARRVYRCKRRHAGGVCPAPARSPREPIEALVIAFYENYWWKLFEARTSPVILPGEPAPDVDGLTEALAIAERRLEQALAPEVQDAAGEGWAAMVHERRKARDNAALALGRARAESGTPDRVGTYAGWLRGFRTTDPATRRELIARDFPVIALRRDGELIGFPSHVTQPDVPKRGLRGSVPTLHPITATGDSLPIKL
jgi:DNA invertase Pin-like site-specific DNA recombinase